MTSTNRCSPTLDIVSFVRVHKSASRAPPTHLTTPLIRNARPLVDFSVLNTLVRLFCNGVSSKGGGGALLACVSNERAPCVSKDCLQTDNVSLMWNYSDRENRLRKFIIPCCIMHEATRSKTCGYFPCWLHLLIESAFCFPFVNNLIWRVLKAVAVLATPARELQQTPTCFS